MSKYDSNALEILSEKKTLLILYIIISKEMLRENALLINLYFSLNNIYIKYDNIYLSGNISEMTWYPYE